MTSALLIIPDALGDRPAPALGGLTPLEAAHTPNMDALVRGGVNGLCSVFGPGIRVGSPIAIHVMFGYDPEACEALARCVGYYETDGLLFKYRYRGNGDGILFISGGASPDLTDSDPLGPELPVIKVEPLACISLDAWW